MRKLGTATILSLSLALALAACGGDDSSTDSTSTASTTTSTSSTADANAQFCSDLSALKAEATQVTQLNSSDLSVNTLTQQADQIDSTAQSLKSSSAALGSQLSSEVSSAVDDFKSQTASIGDQSIPEALVTLGKALGSLEASLNKVGSEIGCS